MATVSGNRRVAGGQALAYLGVNPITPPNLLTYGFPPQTDDNHFIIGTLWLVIDPALPSPPSPQIWALGNVVGLNATWVKLYPSSGTGLEEAPTNLGTAIVSNSTLNVFGTNVITTSGSGNTVTVALVNGNNGQLIMGGSTQPIWNNVTSTGGTVTITNGANTIDLSVSMSEVAHTFVTNSGTAIESGGILNVLGSGLLTTSGSGNTVTAAMTGGLNGQVPIGSTSAPTIYANITSSNGSVIITNGPNSINLSVVASANSAFFYYQATNYSKSVSQVDYYLGASVKLTKAFDNNNDVYVGAGSYTTSPSIAGAAYFTAPVNGIYHFGVGVTSSQPVSPGALLYLTIGSQAFQLTISSYTTDIQWATVTTKMNAGQTAYCGYRSWPFNQTIFGGNGSPTFPTYFWGHIVTEL
jgi:hypothetical protein